MALSSSSRHPVSQARIDDDVIETIDVQRLQLVDKKAAKPHTVSEDDNHDSTEAMEKNENEISDESDGDESIGSPGTNTMQRIRKQRNLNKDRSEELGDKLMESVVPTAASATEDKQMICNHCKEPIKETEDRRNEYPFAYSDKSMITVYHRKCHRARKQIELEKIEVNNEFMSICNELRASKAKSKKLGVKPVDDISVDEAWCGKDQRSRRSLQPERVESLDEFMHDCTSMDGSEGSASEKSKVLNASRQYRTGYRCHGRDDEFENDSSSHRDYDSYCSDEDDSYYRVCKDDERYDANSTDNEEGYHRKCTGEARHDKRKGSRSRSLNRRDPPSRRARSRSQSRTSHDQRHQRRSRSISKNRRSSYLDETTRALSVSKARSRHSSRIGQQKIKERQKFQGDASLMHTQLSLDMNEQRSEQEACSNRHRAETEEQRSDQEDCSNRHRVETKEQRSIRGDRSVCVSTTSLKAKEHRPSKIKGNRKVNVASSQSQRSTRTSAPSITTTCHSQRSTRRSAHSVAATSQSQRSCRTSAPSVMECSHSQRSSRTSVPSVTGENFSQRSSRVSAPSVRSRSHSQRSKRTSAPSVLAFSHSHRSTRTSALSSTGASHSQRSRGTSGPSVTATSHSQRSSRTSAPSITATSHSQRSSRTSTRSVAATSDSQRSTRTSISMQPKVQSNVKMPPSQLKSIRASSQSPTTVKKASMRTEPKNQEAMSKMFGKGKAAANSKKALVVRKRPTSRATAE